MGAGGTIHGHTVLVISKVYLLVIVLIIEFINIIYIYINPVKRYCIKNIQEPYNSCAHVFIIIR